MTSSTLSSINDTFQVIDSPSNLRINSDTTNDDEPSTTLHAKFELNNNNDNGFECIVEALSERIEKLEAENCVLKKNQGPTCGVCMDNKVCKILSIRF